MMALLRFGETNGGLNTDHIVAWDDGMRYTMAGMPPEPCVFVTTVHGGDSGVLEFVGPRRLALLRYLRCQAQEVPLLDEAGNLLCGHEGRRASLGPSAS
jgi:hypothetical protein